MPREYFKIVPACYLILMKDNKILLLRRQNTGYEDGNYSFIAGHLEGNESFKQAMIREAKEEAGIDIDLEKLEVIHVMHRSTKNNENERVDVFLKADEWGGEIQNMESHKCADLTWFALDDLPDNIVPCVRQAVECVKGNCFYSEFDF